MQPRMVKSVDGFALSDPVRWSFAKVALLKIVSGANSKHDMLTGESSGK